MYSFDPMLMMPVCKFLTAAVCFEVINLAHSINLNFIEFGHKHYAFYPHFQL